MSSWINQIISGLTQACATDPKHWSWSLQHKCLDFFLDFSGEMLFKYLSSHTYMLYMSHKHTKYSKKLNLILTWAAKNSSSHLKMKRKNNCILHKENEAYCYNWGEICHVKFVYMLKICSCFIAFIQSNNDFFLLILLFETLTLKHFPQKLLDVWDVHRKPFY